MNRILSCIYIIFSGALLFLSCKKTDDTPPVIKVTTPVSGSRYEVMDTIAVSAIVTDETRLEAIKVTLMNSAYIPVLQTKVYTPETNTFTINSLYEIADIRLQSGNYFITITATDGRNDVNEYIPVYLTEVPRKRTGVFLFSEDKALQQVNILYADSAFNISPLMTLSGDFLDAAANSYYQNLYSIGQYTGALVSVDVTKPAIKWNIPAVVSPAPWYTAFLYADDLCYAAYYNGDLKAYDRNGGLNYFLVSPSQTYLRKMFRHSNYLIADQKDILTKGNTLVVYYLSSAQLKQQKLLKYDVTAIFSKDEDNLLLIGDSAGQSKMELYSLTGNGFWEPNTLPPGKMTSVIQIDPYNYLMSHNTGIYRYNYSVNSLTLWRPEPADFLKYDEFSGEVIAVTNNQITVYSYPSASPLYTFTAADTISSIVVMYNK